MSAEVFQANYAQVQLVVILTRARIGHVLVTIYIIVRAIAVNGYLVVMVDSKRSNLLHMPGSFPLECVHLCNVHNST